MWNYGTFDFNQPNFIGRFVSGQTDYMVQSYPFEWFLPEYVRRGSHVEEQELLISPAEKERLLAALQRNARPENAVYRYNYVKDNCATRITAMLDSTLDRRIIFTDSTRFGTYRKAMRHYHADYPWYQFGIDLVLGSGLDCKVPRRAETFAPIEMHDAYARARFTGSGQPVVGPSKVLYAGEEHPTLPPTPWYLTPLAASAVCVCLSAGAWVLWLRKKRLARWWISLYFGITGLAGCLVAYLAFFSSHEATAPNLLLMWLNPLQLVPAAGVWFRSWKWPSLAVAVYDTVALPILLMAWPSQPQSGSAAIFLFMTSAPLLGALYAIKSVQTSYNINIPSSSQTKRDTRRKTGAKTARRRPAGKKQ